MQDLQNPEQNVETTPVNQPQQGYASAAQTSEPAPAQPNNYLVIAILSTLCCCLPLGIVSIVYAAKVNGLYMGRQYEAAEQASKNAKKWAIIAAVVGLVCQIIYGVVYGVAVLPNMMGN